MALNTDQLGTLIGPMTSSSETTALGGEFAKYEQDFATYSDQHWASDGSNWEASNYYDRAYIDYVAYARTGDEKYLNQADAIVSDYVKNYVEPNNFGVASWWSMPKGIAAHYLLHGDQESLDAIGKMADQAVNPWNTENNWANLFDPHQAEGREQARTLETLTQAIILDAPSNGVPNIQANGEDWGVQGGNDFKALAKSLVDKILTSDFQHADGSRPNYVEGTTADGSPIDKPFMNGLMNDALINYYEQVDADPRIVDFIKANLDYMWTHEWDASAKAFQYMDENSSNGTEATPSPDLNMLVVNGFGFVYQHTGDATYLERGDEVFAGGVEGNWLDGSKQFNQEYATSYKYLAYTQGDHAGTGTGAADSSSAESPVSDAGQDASSGTANGSDVGTGSGQDTTTTGSIHDGADSNASPLASLIGPMTSSSETTALGGEFAKYEQDFATYNDQHWASDGSNWEASNYYDRAYIDYVAYARTGDEKYLNQADAIVSDYVKNYVEPNNFGVASWWSMPKGIAAHYLLHGDQESLDAIGKMADQAVNPWNTENNWANLFDPHQAEGREQARTLETLTQAIILDAPSNGVPNIQANGEDWGVQGGNDFKALAKSLVDKILTSDFQHADGSRPNYVEGTTADGSPIDKPFMNGLMNDALINYYEQVDADPRIVDFIKANLDYMWTHEWDASAKAFQYMDENSSNGTEATPSPDLNMLVVNGFGFVYQHTGDATYLERGDEVFAGGVEGNWLDGSKQFNQEYATSYKYLAYTQGDHAGTGTAVASNFAAQSPVSEAGQDTSSGTASGSGIGTGAAQAKAADVSTHDASTETSTGSDTGSGTAQAKPTDGSTHDASAGTASGSDTGTGSAQGTSTDGSTTNKGHGHWALVKDGTLSFAHLSNGTGHHTQSGTGSTWNSDSGAGSSWHFDHGNGHSQGDDVQSDLSDMTVHSHMPAHGWHLPADALL
ncbi:hypothetical protein SAZ10_15025 [Mesorhizobium sp. BAC0120]|uniref:hypothetical protein n=1 Tax=Mesorhizobium sp. BAC0120 TaxID=3090670 RepID=UPI00298C1227|nr:hypothetical protein [Mesorhizobium sp. BAC0120]MDW6023072.1 hypothetical protein [Mesorhizobium sp. BAC0120]